MQEKFALVSFQATIYRSLAGTRFKSKITQCPVKFCLNLLHFESDRGLKMSGLCDVNMNTGHRYKLTVTEFACYQKAEQEPAI